MTTINPTIITKHTCHIEYFTNDDADVNTVLRIEMRINDFKKPPFIEWISSSGGACFNPHIMIEGQNKKHVIDFANKIIRLIGRYKNTRVVSA